MNLQDFLAHYKTLHAQNDHLRFYWDVNTNIIQADFLNRITQDFAVIPSALTAEGIGFGPLAFDPKDGLFLVSEIAVPIDSLPQAISILKEVITKWGNKGLAVTDVAGRFVSADRNALLSPVSQCDSVFLNIATLVGNQYEGLYREIEERLYEIQGRPNWGKINFLNYEKVLSLYGENFLRYLEVKKRFDPKNVFSNEFTQRVLAWQPLS
jgi:FAD/FMN-containing dehydrogenase